MVIWLIGLSGAGKSAISSQLQSLIRDKGRPCVVLDGDVIRDVFDNDLTHSLEGRRKNADRICRLGKFLDSQGINVVTAILSIFPEHREWNRSNVDNYFEVFVDAAIEDVMARDTKKLYSRALAKEIRDVVGVDIPFPVPESPDLVIRNTFTEPVDSLAQQVLSKIAHRLS